MTDPASSDASSTLCSACGLCCDGSFFAQLTLRDDELPRLQKLSLPLVRGHHLAQPCVMHRGDRCAIYADRPSACARYRCVLLRDLEQGVVTLEVATLKVNRMRALIAAVQGVLGAGARGEALFAAAQAFFDTAQTAAARRDHADLLLDMAEFLAMSRRDFGVGASSEEVDQAAVGELGE